MSEPLPNFEHLSIVTAPHPALDTRAEDVGVVDASVRLLAARMVELMHRGVVYPDGAKVKGIGLAANQVNVLKRVIVVDVPGPRAYWTSSVKSVTAGPLVLINPVVTPQECDPGEWGDEGCLSQPELGFSLRVRRWRVVNVSALTPGSREISFVASGLLSRAVQHCVDLLDGLTPDRRAKGEGSPRMFAEAAGAMA